MRLKLLLALQVSFNILFGQVSNETACNRVGNPLVIKNLPKSICFPKGYKAFAVNFLDFDTDGKEDLVVELNHINHVKVDSNLVQFYKGTASGYRLFKEFNNIYCPSINKDSVKEEDSEFLSDFAFVFYKNDTISISGCDNKYCENHAYFVYNREVQTWILSYMEFVNYVAMGRTLTQTVYRPSKPIDIKKFSPNNLVHGIIDNLPLRKEFTLDDYPDRGVLYEMEAENKFPFSDTIRIGEIHASKKDPIPDSVIAEAFHGVTINNTKEKLIDHVKWGNEWYKLYGSTVVKWGRVLAIELLSNNEPTMFLLLLDQSGFLRNVYKVNVNDSVVLSVDSISLINKNKIRSRVIDNLLLLH